MESQIKIGIERNALRAKRTFSIMRKDTRECMTKKLNKKILQNNSKKHECGR